MDNLRVPYSGPNLKKPSLLKDFLLDDLSSCSSNGFRSFPRRQCCTTTIRFLVDLDLTRKKQIPPTHRRSQRYSPVKSVFQRASTALINAVKHLPFASAAAKPRRAILPRSFSRNLFKRSFWKKSDRKEIVKWSSFHTVVDSKSEPTVFSPVKTTAESGGTREYKSYCSNSWSDSEFTSGSTCSSGNSATANSSENDVVVESKKKIPAGEEIVTVGKIIGVIVGEATTTPAANSIGDGPTKQWPNMEKQQFSPVSVLACPFGNEDAVEEEEEVSSPFKNKIAPTEGKRHKVRQNLRRLKSLSKLKPVDLEKRIALADSNHESVVSPHLDISNNEEDGNKTEEKAMHLLKQLKAETTFMSFKFDADNIFLDFFKEATMDDNNNVSDCELFDLAKSWMNGQPREIILGWETQKNRQAYIREMEKGGMWGKSDEDREEVALDLETEIFSALLNDLFFFLTSSNGQQLVSCRSNVKN